MGKPTTTTPKKKPTPSKKAATPPEPATGNGTNAPAVIPPVAEPAPVAVVQPVVKAKRATKPKATAAPKAPATPKLTPTRKAPAKAKAKPTPVAYTYDDIALRAYFIAQARHAQGLHGSPEGDWVEAERQLQAGIKA